jgi:hypothetical protein
MAERLQAAEEKLRKANSNNAQMIFDMEMEVIQNFHIHTPSRVIMREILDQANTETR